MIGDCLLTGQNNNNRGFIINEEDKPNLDSVRNKITKNLSKPRIAHIINTDDIGGAELLFSHIAKGLSDYFDFYLICLGKSTNRNNSVFDLSNYKTVFYCQHKYKSFDFFESAALEINEFCKENKITLVHSSNQGIYLRKRLKTFRDSFLVIETYHSVDGFKYYYIQPDERSIKLEQNEYHYLTGVEDNVTAFMKEIFPNETNNILRIYNGVDINKFTPGAVKYRENSKFTIGYAGRISQEKNITDIFSVANIFTDITFKIIGGVNDSGAGYWDRIKHLKPDNVKITGYTDSVSKELEGCDLFLMCSITEGFPLSIIEAMLMYLPVISSNVGGISQQIIHGETGYLFDCGDIDTACDHIRLLLSDPSLRKKMGYLAHERATTRFSYELMIQQYLNYYSRFL